MARRTEQFATLTENEYIKKVHELFQQACPELTVEAMDMLLVLWQKTDRLLLRNRQKGEA